MPVPFPVDDIPVIQLRRISKSFPGVTALDGVNLDLRAGTIHALLGENGAGKSTLINMLTGVLALGLAGHLQGTDFEEKTLEAIGVAVVGGIAITGGRGSVWGICPAALLFRILEKGWALLHISPYWQQTIVGSLLLLAILTDRVWRHHGEGAQT